MFSFYIQDFDFIFEGRNVYILYYQWVRKHCLAMNSLTITGHLLSFITILRHAKGVASPGSKHQRFLFIKHLRPFVYTLTRTCTHILGFPILVEHYFSKLASLLGFTSYYLHVSNVSFTLLISTGGEPFERCRHVYVYILCHLLQILKSLLLSP